MRVADRRRRRAEPNAGGAVDWGAEWPLLAALAVALLAVYAGTSPRTATLEDDGLFIIAALHAGVAHPPGYPLYTLIGHLFSYLPIDPPALRIHLASGVLGAAACGVLYLAVRLAGLAPALALTTALAYGVSEHFWSQAIIAEVYTLNSLLCFGVLLFCLRALQRGAHLDRELALAALCFGLGLTNHWPLTVLAFPAFFVLLLPLAGQVFPRLPFLLAIAFVPPIVFYGWMVWRSQQEGVISFYGPLEDWGEFWYYISRSGYGSVDVSESARIWDKLRFVQHFFGEVLFQYTPVGAALACLGLYRLYLRRAFAMLVATAWIFCAHSLLLIQLLAFDYEFLNLAVFRPYPLVAYGLMAFWVSLGIAHLLEQLPVLLAGRPRIAALLGGAPAAQGAVPAKGAPAAQGAALRKGGQPAQSVALRKGGGAKRGQLAQGAGLAKGGGAQRGQLAQGAGPAKGGGAQRGQLSQGAGPAKGGDAQRGQLAQGAGLAKDGQPQPGGDSVGAVAALLGGGQALRALAQRWTGGTTALGIALPCLALLIPIILLYKNFAVNDRRDDTTALRYAEVLLHNLEPNASLFVTGDLPTAPVGYLRYGEMVRDDVAVLNTQGLVYPTRLFSPPTSKSNETGLNRKYVNDAKGPVYYTTNIVDFPNDHGSIHYGLYRQVAKDGPELQLRFDDLTEQYFYDLVAMGVTEPHSTDRWNRHLHDRLMQQFGEYIGYMVLASVDEPDWLAKRDRMVEAMQAQYFGLIGMAEMLIKYGNNAHLPQVQIWLDHAETLVSHTMSKEMLGRHYYRRGYLAFRQGRPQQARELFHKSLELHPHPENPSEPALGMLRQPERPPAPRRTFGPGRPGP